MTDPAGPGPRADLRQIGRYQVESTLGRGAMGVIYKAHDPVIDRTVAIKLVNADLLEGEERADYVARFRQEAQAAGRCSHPNIVGIYDFALHEGNPYLAMEYIDGTTLGQVGRARVFTVPEIVQVMGQVLDALQAAHALGVVHRDIKPANIMLTRQGTVKVTDFGISRIASSQLTGAGSVVGTPSYMSPEQCRGDPVDARSDVFSAGVVLYELVTGQKPFLGRTQHELWQRLLHEAPADPAGLRPGLPPAIGAVIRRSLAKDPAARFASASAMAAALRGMATPAAPPEIPDGATIVLPGAAGSLDLDSSAVSTIERQLARYIGPIAIHLVRNAVRSSGDVDALCKTLASNIEGAAGRERFTQEVQATLDPALARSAIARSGVTGLTAVPARFTEAELERLEKELTRHIGPVARVLVKRAAKAGGSLGELWLRLAEHVEKPADRAAFLRAQDR